ncbi:mitochondrial assembly of ribosomal large subunit protein 1 isoform X2 [Tamandua tetradactyla]|uniref:mitochondrial assembly of ribosomal large subunit protein 1 isoform X2 n=1 Tax=Tamandua tetradactyla TaxID=48850 RepID=UPI00405407A1
MGSGGGVARRLGVLLWGGVVPRGAKLVVDLGARPQLPAVGRLPAGRALCLARDPARCLHVGSRIEQLADGAAGQGLLESGAADHPSPKFDIDVLVSLLRQENAKDICVIKVPPEMKYTDYFVLGSAVSTRHLHAVAHYIVKMYKHLKYESEPHVKIEGKDTDDWLCVDFDPSLWEKPAAMQPCGEAHVESGPCGEGLCLPPTYTHPSTAKLLPNPSSTENRKTSLRDGPMQAPDQYLQIH